MTAAARRSRAPLALMLSSALQLAARFLIAVIHVYQRTLSRLLGPVCRFEPSCSVYAAACLETHGLVRGGLL